MHSLNSVWVWARCFKVSWLGDPRCSLVAAFCSFVRSSRGARLDSRRTIACLYQPWFVRHNLASLRESCPWLSWWSGIPPCYFPSKCLFLFLADLIAHISHSFIPHIFVWVWLCCCFCFCISHLHLRLLLLLFVTHNFFTHHLSHTSFTQLCHAHTHTTLSHTIFTHNFVTHHLCHTQPFTYNCLTDRSSTTSFVYPPFPIPLELLFKKSWLVGFSGPLISLNACCSCWLMLNQSLTWQVPRPVPSQKERHLAGKPTAAESMWEGDEMEASWNGGTPKWLVYTGESH